MRIDKIEIEIEYNIQILIEKYFKENYNYVTFANSIFQDVICEKLKSFGIDVKYCWGCSSIKLKSDFYEEKHSECKPCTEKRRNKMCNGNWGKAVRKTNGRCAICGDLFEHVHHIIPKAMGGTDDLDNLVPLCKVCHKEAHNGAFSNKLGINYDMVDQFQNKCVCGYHKNDEEGLKILKIGKKITEKKEEDKC